MGLIILLLMIGVPIAEIAVFLEAGDRFGFWPTIVAIIATAFIGNACMRHQGLGVLRRVQESMARQEMPLREVFDGLCLLIAGALLLTPGFITDTVGFCLLFPPFRHAVGTTVAARFIQRQQSRNHGGMNSGNGGGGAQYHRKGNSPRGFPNDGPVIDGEFEEVSPNTEAADQPHNETLTDKTQDKN